MSINDKIKQVLLAKNLSPSYLADDIGVQRSSISHILSGRNRPSLDIIQKIVRRFPEFTYEWFLEDDAQLSTDSFTAQQDAPPPTAMNRTTIRADRPAVANTGYPTARIAVTDGPIVPKQVTFDPLTPTPPVADEPGRSVGKQIDRILIFYTDGTFREYTPA
ncbi:helix-turn-helix transcriptional regulator [Fibrella aquatilis]|uniref:Helix-turn-helix transcriptional regulator n=1 Tax=Fibrella aquatilis TaxID=2817059 RepID=A0A939G1U2_9BACT|nr:helix-turn-helix transcriptional regulator [Fibrella aquatilis]MBO0929683.1 helix-turn-helix transcriptional regulator [Fibrella aquatilis]